MPQRLPQALRHPGLLLIAAAMLAGGCHWQWHESPYVDPVHHAAMPIMDVELPREQPNMGPANDPMALAGLPPQTLRNETPRQIWPLTLEQAVQLALGNSDSFREAGGKVVTAPELTVTRYDPALQENDPRFGVPAALSAFDAQFATGLYFGQNERVINNLSETGVRMFRQDFANFDAQITKRTAVGTQLYARHVTQYDANNNPTNLFPSAYNVWFEGGFRQPLLQGAGLEFNRIAGPNARPGEYNGVVIARLRSDMKLVDFELAVRDLLRDIEQVYWELSYAYREADAKRANLDRTVRAWQIVRTHAANGDMDGSQEAFARERVFAAEVELQNALSGTPVETRARVTGNPQPLATHGGVYSLERRLRFLLGLPSSDDRLIRPVDDPMSAEVMFDWYEAVSLAMFSRPELRKQQWAVKQRELELIASRSFGRAKLDVIGDLRWRGFGNDLFGNAGVPNGSAFAHLFDGGTQEFRLGMQMETPVGNRIGHTAVRHAELALARERAVYRNQELEITHELNASFNELDRAFLTIGTNYNRRRAAHDRLAALEAKFDHRKEGEDDLLLDLLFTAQQRVLSADMDFFRSLVDYNIAIARLHVSRGSYLDYLNVQLAEAPWMANTYRLASVNARRFRPNWSDQCLTKPPPVSVGLVPEPDRVPAIERLPAPIDSMPKLLPPVDES